MKNRNLLILPLLLFTVSGCSLCIKNKQVSGNIDPTMRKWMPDSLGAYASYVLDSSLAESFQRIDQYEVNEESQQSNGAFRCTEITYGVESMTYKGILSFKNIQYRLLGYQEGTQFALVLDNFPIYMDMATSSTPRVSYSDGSTMFLVQPLLSNVGEYTLGGKTYSEVMNLGFDDESRFPDDQIVNCHFAPHWGIIRFALKNGEVWMLNP